ncbi:MAG: sulfotransferase domain-containing protein, partial [Endozoicomonadaceae bacterium]|nr:sulfotransferase domain-containing protein [Endozoicomonadaceae bacterium]
MTKPDFIIIGAMKSATSTLHTQLALQPGIFLTNPKEPNYFSDDSRYNRGEAWYDALFLDAKQDDICGESSTHYTKLPDYPDTVKRMSKRLETPKLIYLMRHPIDRLVSQYIHQWSQNVFKYDINQAIDRYEELTAYSCYALQLEPYIKQFGGKNILPIFTEAIKKEPQKQLERVARFIGYKGNVLWHDDVGEQNVSRERIRPFPGYSWLVQSKLMTLLRRGLVPQSIRNKIKNQYTMQERPVIDEIHLKQLNTLFNQDLKSLSKWV